MILVNSIKLSNDREFFMVYKLCINHCAFLCFSIVMLSCIYQTKKIDIKETTDNEKEEKPTFEKIITLLKNKVVIALTLIYLASGVYATAYDFVGQIGLRLGINVSLLISFSGILVFVNALIAICITNSCSIKRRKNYFLFDIVFDVVPALIFAFTNNAYLFIFSLFLTSIKDIFAPITFAYIVSCFNQEDGFIALGLLGSISSFISILFPIIFGYLIIENYQLLFLISAILILISSVIAKVLLPNK